MLFKKVGESFCYAGFKREYKVCSLSGVLNLTGVDLSLFSFISFVLGLSDTSCLFSVFFYPQVDKIPSSGVLCSCQVSLWIVVGNLKRWEALHCVSLSSCLLDGCDVASLTALKQQKKTQDQEKSLTL